MSFDDKNIPSIFLPPSTSRSMIRESDRVKRAQLGDQLRPIGARPRPPFSLRGCLAHPAARHTPTGLTLLTQGRATSRDWVEGESQIRKFLGVPEVRRHSGNNIATEVLYTIEAFGIEENIGYFTLDNAENNDTALEAIGKKLGFNGARRRGRCFGHIVNLSAKALLFGKDTDAFEEQLSGAEALSEAEYELWRQKGPVGKLHNFVVDVDRSDRLTYLLKELQEYDISMSDDPKIRSKSPVSVVLDNDTRWLSQLYMIRRALRLRRYFELLVAKFRIWDLEESTIIQYVLDLDSRSFPPRLCGVRDMANRLLADRDGAPVGPRWASNFVKRQQELSTRFTRRYDYQRALCEDPKIIGPWFELVRNTIAKYGIHDDDIHNVDETGFMMGMISTTMVVTSSERRSKPSLAQPGDREWVSVIQSINSRGETIPPFIIVAGQYHLSNWYEVNVGHPLTGHTHLPDTPTYRTLISSSFNTTTPAFQPRFLA
ncbi:restless-like transposase [Pochonia chlamydosporia 170]|uniref:Restless-like transposase n=1 Tax=Pochonia chlamydosporia 170 TaxID=1380566 RepID=A0A179EY90_METCM|nr:restless-like transposase [Pochonia chlamydosporia 170]OAQ58122.1 restless-like transposase [Pochonia chlamydosporia 170]